MWKPIPETNGAYEVNSIGDVRVVVAPVTVNRGDTTYTRATTGKVLKQYNLQRKKTTPPYAFVYVRSNGKSKRRAVHALVLDAFHGPRPPGMQCRHLDGNSLNNSIENLAWGTPEENRADIRRHGRTAEGERSGMTSLRNEDVIAIRVMSARGMSFYQLAKWFGICERTVSRIASGASWPKLVAALEAAPERKP